MIVNAVWFVGLFGGGAILASIALQGALALPPLRRWHPRTRARLHTWSAGLPILAGALVLAATFLPHPWLGLPDHCLANHGHLHLCVTCGLPTPPLAFSAFAALYGAWVLARLGRVIRQLAVARAALRQMSRTETRRGDLALLPMPGAVAFVAGFLHPRVFVSEAACSPEWSAVLAHERDHKRHRDPLARLVARLLLAVAPPLLSSGLERRLRLLQELAADEAAAREVGDRIEVARQVVAWAQRQRSPSLAAAFGDGDVSTRVRVLMESPAYASGPTLSQAVVAASALLAALLSLAPSIHHGVERIVHLFHL